jgi:protein subunit release factor A
MSEPTNKQILFSVTKKDLVIEYFSGTGNGGQHKNKHQNCCRVKHPPSGAVGLCQEERSKVQNTKKAFRRMVDSDKFQAWLRLETARRTGEIAEIEKAVDKSLSMVKLEVRDERGLWVEVSENELTKEEE